MLLLLTLAVVGERKAGEVRTNEGAFERAGDDVVHEDGEISSQPLGSIRGELEWDTRGEGDLR